MAVTVNLVLWVNNWQFGVINCSLVINGGRSEVRVCLVGGRGAGGKIAFRSDEHSLRSLSVQEVEVVGERRWLLHSQSKKVLKENTARARLAWV